MSFHTVTKWTTVGTYLINNFYQREVQVGKDPHEDWYIRVFAMDNWNPEDTLPEEGGMTPEGKGIYESFNDATKAARQLARDRRREYGDTSSKREEPES